MLTAEPSAAPGARWRLAFLGVDRLLGRSPRTRPSPWRCRTSPLAPSACSRSWSSRGRAAAGRLGASIEDLATSFVHIHVNRLIRSAQRAHEAVFYDFLWHLDRARRARGLES